MANGSYKGKTDTQCPFYKFDDQQKMRIVCEGIVEKSNLAWLFKRRRDFNLQMSVFCCEHYKKCEIYRAVMAAKYDEED